MTSSPKSSTRLRHRATGAFTLIELLVVIAIILVLAALALPVLAQATRHARTAQCIGNLRQLATACRAYTNTSHGILPGQYGCGTPTWLMGDDPARETPANFETAPQEGQLFPHYNDPALVLCPSDRKGNGRFSYSCCINIRYRVIDQVENATAAILIIEEDPAYYLNHPSYPQWRDGGFSSSDLPAIRHGGKTSVGYFDGHAAQAEFPRGIMAREIEIRPWGFAVIQPWP